MMRVRRASVIVTLALRRPSWATPMIAYVLALTLMAGIAVAEAEVTWVLWTRSGDGTWTRRAAWGTKAHCEDPLRAPRALVIFDELDPLGIRDKTERERKCLPDTVDPRGPKGK